MTQQQMLPPRQRPQPQPVYDTGRSRPRRLDVFLHAGKTFRLLGSLMVDRRVALWRKAAFLATIAGMLVLLFFPDLLGEFVLSTVLPIAGTVLGIPIDASFDWVAFALVVVSLLRVFPPELVAEHYRTIFRKEYQPEYQDYR